MDEIRRAGGVRRYTQPPLEPAKPGEQIARKIKSAFPEPSNDFLGKPNVRPYYCEECDRSFLCQSSVDRHLWYHLRRKVGMWKQPTPPGENFECGECGAEFRLQDTFVEHVATHLSFLCPCRMAYSNKLGLERHTLASHAHRNAHDFQRRERRDKVWEERERPQDDDE
ncbi:zinc finger protein 555-like [Thrips palmi]|uniref:Zinc finger protein 555-like n=1 Tax=Thrips palmi TaxID=161013 RepID=A0A6P8YLW5_THRPL|nr:zinc finger protein 555-like [Thrips palmi]